MTWKEFKDYVESKGVRDDFEFGGMDCAGETKDLHVRIFMVDNEQAFTVDNC